MNRELKFRVWCVHPESDESFFDYFDIYSNDLQNLASSLVIIDKIEQYTGLKDRNDKEIYEGDIVKWNINDTEKTGVVVFDVGSFWLDKDLSTGFSICNDWYSGEYEVIGNVHEDPELLETTK
jgi:uncharacterized phage protein (TIGR01671 family)